MLHSCAQGAHCNGHSCLPRGLVVSCRSCPFPRSKLACTSIARLVLFQGWRHRRHYPRPTVGGGPGVHARNGAWRGALLECSRGAAKRVVSPQLVQRWPEDWHDNYRRAWVLRRWPVWHSVRIEPNLDSLASFIRLLITGLRMCVLLSRQLKM